MANQLNFLTILKPSILLFFFFHCICKSVTSQSTSISFGFSCVLARNASISYQNNVNSLFSVFNALASQTSYLFTSVGYPPDVVHGYYMCRGDISSQTCNSCIANATRFAQKTGCKFQEGFLNSNKCIFRYASYSMFATLEPPGFITTGPPTANVSNYKHYNQTLGTMMKALITEAAFRNGSTLSRVPNFATKKANVSGSETIYGLAQCTPDLVPDDCSRCLNSALSSLRLCCDGARGAQTVRPNCLLLYDNSSFYESSQESLRPTRTIVMIFSILILNWFNVYIGGRWLT